MSIVFCRSFLRKLKVNQKKCAWGSDEIDEHSANTKGKVDMTLPLV
jgi:hypothetical protein